VTAGGRRPAPRGTPPGSRGCWARTARPPRRGPRPRSASAPRPPGGSRRSAGRTCSRDRSPRRARRGGRCRPGRGGRTGNSGRGDRWHLDVRVRAAKDHRDAPPAGTGLGSLGSLGRAEQQLPDDAALHLRRAGVDGAGAGVEVDAGPGRRRVRRAWVVGLVPVRGRPPGRGSARPAPSTSTASSVTTRWYSLQSSLNVAASAPGSCPAISAGGGGGPPCARSCSTWTWHQASRRRMSGSVSRPRSRVSSISRFSSPEKPDRRVQRPSRRARSRAASSPPTSPGRARRRPGPARCSRLSKNTSLKSASPVRLRIGRTSTPGWSSGTSSMLMPRCGAGGRVRPGQHEHPVRPVGPRGPELLPVEHPAVAVRLGPQRQAGQVGPPRPARKKPCANTYSPETIFGRKARAPARGRPFAASCCPAC